MPQTPNFNLSLPDKGAKNWHIDVNDNFTAIDTALDDHATELQDAHASGVYTAESPFADLDGRLDTIESELQGARFDFSDPAQRLRDYLAVGHNTDGTNKTGSFTFDQWETAGLNNPAYASAQTLTIDGDVTAILQPGTSLRIDFATSGLRYLHVKSAAYTTSTTVTVWDDETVLNESVNSIAYGVYRSNLIGAAGSPGAGLRALTHCSADYLYYATDKYQTPFTAGDIASSNSGHLARVDYASGLQVGLAYASAAPDAALASETHRLNGTDILTVNYTYDGTTGLLTATGLTWA